MTGPVLTPEDGTIVAGANSFVTLDYITQYAANHGNTDWPAITDENVQMQIAILAADYLKNEKRYPYRGAKFGYNAEGTVEQLMPWPRAGATEYRGGPIPPNAIPWRVKDAQSELACQLATSGVVSSVSLQPNLKRGGGIASTRIGPLSTSYQPTADIETLIMSVRGILQPILYLVLDDLPATLARPKDYPPFAGKDEFDYVRGRSDNPLNSPRGPGFI